jgi:hypothetical protein
MFHCGSSLKYVTTFRKLKMEIVQHIGRLEYMIVPALHDDND